MTEQKKTEKKADTITFDNDLCGNVTVNREKLVRSIENEHRSYGAHSCKIQGNNDFNLPELEKVIPSGFKLDLVVKLKDNLGQKGNKKGEKMIL